MAIQVASTSSLNFSSQTKYRYDIFLSFRGIDTRDTFTVSLYNALRRKGINAFIDDKKLSKGERIAPALLKAIERSRISIIVFSINYATSTWCLDELAHIIQCKEGKNQQVMPIFYKVNPKDVQDQENSFKEAMAAHEDRFRDDKEKVRKWRSALSKAARLESAWLFKDGCESGFIDRIVQHAYSMLPPKHFHNVGYIVGLEPRIEEVKSLLDETNNSVSMFGIYGTGGIGKTTFAKALYYSIFFHFEGACFLLDVKEVSKKYQGVLRLQQTLLSEILEEKEMKFGSVGQGKSIIKHRLSNKKVLLVLDDVDEVQQLEQLAGGYDWFGCGSKIIITTRNKQLLIAYNVAKTYEMKPLNHFCSLELFCWHAFRMRQPPNDYRNMSNHVVRYAHGLPLALKLVGSNLANKDKDEWTSTLEMYKRIPEATIFEVLKISYDCLQEGAKRVFLDIACFFKKKTLEFIEDILEACDDGARFYMEILVDKSLITIINENGCRLYMHDLIQQMGKEIVRQGAPSNPGQRSRIWYYKDVLKVLQENLGSDNIEGIILDPPHQEVVEWSGMAFEKMNNLKILIIRNAQFSTNPKYFPNSLRLLDWKGYPSTTLPQEFSPSKLICLKLYGSPFRLEKPFKRFEYVTYLNFSKCKYITEVPDMSEFQNLKRLIFRKCHNLTKVHDSMGFLSKLEILNASECPILTRFPREINMPSLQELHLSFCKSLDYFPRIERKMEELYGVSAAMTGIKELPPSIGNLPELYHLDLSFCKSLRELPNSLLTVPNLGNLELADIHPLGRESFKKLMLQSQPYNFCENIETLDLNSFGLLDEDLHLTLKCFQNVKDLSLSSNDFVSLPECIKECPYLEMLQVNDCKRLRDIPELPSALLNIAAKNCTSLTTKSSSCLWSQAKEVFPRRIVMPATTFPDWFDCCCKGGKLSFRVRGNFPHVLVAYEMGKLNASLLSQKKGKNTWLLPLVEVFMSINGQNKLPWIQKDGEARKKGLVWSTKGDQGHVIFHDLLSDLDEEDLEGLNKFLGLDWNDVDIKITCFPPDIMSIVNCGIYVDKQQTDMENVLFMSGSLKRRVVASHHNEPPKKQLRMFKEKINC